MPPFLRNEMLRPPLLAIVLLVAPASAALAEEEAALELGKQVFTTEAVPKCAICHTLSDAEAAGEIGPNLDELKPNKERVRLAVKGGVGSMPAYGETLTQEQIDAVSLYVEQATGAGE